MSLRELLNVVHEDTLIVLINVDSQKTLETYFYGTDEIDKRYLDRTVMDIACDYGRLYVDIKMEV